VPHDRGAPALFRLPAFESFILADESVYLKIFFYLIAEFFGIERLYDEIARALPDGVNRVINTADTRDHDYGDDIIYGSYVREKLETVYSRHGDIGYHEIEIACLKRLERGDSVLERMKNVFPVPDDIIYEFYYRGIVIRKKNMTHLQRLF